MKPFSVGNRACGAVTSRAGTFVNPHTLALGRKMQCNYSVCGEDGAGDGLELLHLAKGRRAGADHRGMKTGTVEAPSELPMHHLIPETDS